MGRRVFRNYYKGHRTKSKGRMESREGGGLGWGGRGKGGEKKQTTIIEQQ